MAAKVRAVRLPSPRNVGTEVGAYRMVAPLGQAAAFPGPYIGGDDPEPDVSDEEWQRELAERETAEGVARQPIHADPVEAAPDASSFMPGMPGSVQWAPSPPVVILAASDLSPLPDRFTVSIERKSNGMWKVTAPEVHVGLFIADTDLAAALSQTPGVLARMVGIDGVAAKRKRRTARGAG